MTTAEKHVTGFVITGEFMTRQAIDFALYENDWQGGYRFLLDNIVGIDHDIVISILRGEKKMTGQAGFGVKNTLALEDTTEEEKTEVQEQMKYLWAGIIKFRPDYWRPYAEVNNWGPHDVNAGFRYGNPRYESESACPPLLPGTRHRFETWAKGRNCEYMNDPRNDRVEYVEVNGVARTVLFEKVGEPPIWVDPITSDVGCWEKAVIEYEEHRGPLGVRGHAQKFRENDIFNEDWKPKEIAAEADRRLGLSDEDDDDEDDIGAKVDRQVKGDLLKSMMATGMIDDPEAAAGTIEAIFGSEDDDLPPDPDTGLIGKYGWITRDGTFYSCLFHKHADLAYRIFKFVERTTDEDILCEPQKAGDAAGWVRLSKSVIDGEPYYNCEKSLSASQKETLEAWANRHGIDLKEMRQTG